MSRKDYIVIADVLKTVHETIVTIKEHRGVVVPATHVLQAVAEGLAEHLVSNNIEVDIATFLAATGLYATD